MRLLALPGLAALLICTPLAAQDDPALVHVRMHRKVAPSIVYVGDRGHEGSGVILSADGLILTASTAVGAAPSGQRVLLPGHREREAKVIARVPALELAVLKIEEKDLPYLEFADSKAAKPGQVCYTFGDSFHSILRDDQVSMSLGVISGIYELPAATPGSGSTYHGPVLETSAAINPNQDGGALVDSSGRLLGMTILGFDRTKFAGLAVPAHLLKPEIERIVKDFRAGIVRPDAPPAPAPPKPEPPPSKGGWAGLELQPSEESSALQVTRVIAGGPAEKAGLKAGDLVVQVEGQKVATLRKFAEQIGRFGPGEALTLKVERDGKKQDFKLTLAKRPVY